MNKIFAFASLTFFFLSSLPCCAQKSAVKSTNKIRFAVVGDTQGGEFGGKFLDELVRDIQKHKPDYVLIPGDLVGDSGLKGWKAWKQKTAALGNRRLMSPGNHDIGPGSTFEAWQSTFDWLPESKKLNGKKGIDQVDYFVDYNGVRFVSISTDRPGRRFSGSAPEALDWLNEVFKDIQRRNNDDTPQNDIHHVFTFSHRPITTQRESRTGGTNGKWWKTMTGQIDDHSIATCAFLPGHWHMYQPSRPDPKVPTMEIIVGTGGGGLEGAAHRNRHGFLVVDVVGKKVTAKFIGDKDHDKNGWNFVDVLDEFNVTDSRTGELAYYDFQGNKQQRIKDKSKSKISKHHPIHLHGKASIESNTARNSNVLSFPDGKSYADAKSIGDNNLAILGNLSLEFDFRLDRGDGTGTLVCFGGAHQSRNRSLAQQESANCIYRVDINREKRVEVSWQYGDSQWQKIVSSKTIDSLDQWHHLKIVRNQSDKTVTIFADGKQLGDRLKFKHAPTGGGSGSLYFGAFVGGKNAIQGSMDNVRISKF